MFGALAEAALCCLPREANPQLLEQHVEFVRPGNGSSMRVEARLLRRGRQLISAEGAIVDGDGQTLARGLATLEERD